MNTKRVYNIIATSLILICLGIFMRNTRDIREYNQSEPPTNTDTLFYSDGFMESYEQDKIFIRTFK